MLLKPLHRWVWADEHRRAGKLLAFAETEADGSRQLVRAAELTRDSLLRRFYLRHALDEQRHGEILRVRGAAILSSLPRRRSTFEAKWLSAGERGPNDLVVKENADEALLAFLHLSERAAARRFAVYRDVLGRDPETQALFTGILRDEVFHMTYSIRQLERISTRRVGLTLWVARLHRIWKAYLRLANAVAGAVGTVVLLAQYFVLLPLFALAAKRAVRRETSGDCMVGPGWTPRAGKPRSLRTQY